MKVKYIAESNCRMCMDSFPGQVGTMCCKCEEMRTHIVTLVSSGGGLFGNKATVFLKGKLETVNIDCIFELSEETDNETG